MAEEKSKIIERQYVIPLRKEWLKAAMYKRSKKASKAAKEFLAHHMKVEISDVKTGKWLNQEVWKHGGKNPPHKVKVNVTKDEKGIVMAELAELSEKAKKIEAKLKAREDTFKQKKGEKKKEETKEKAAEKKEEAAEKAAPEAKEEKEKEKIMHKEISKTEKTEAHKSEQAGHHYETTKPFRQALKK